MQTLTIGLLREEKIPHDHRVAFLPEQCNNIITQFPHIRFLVQPSAHRCVSDAEYQEAGFELSEDLSQADYLFGIKEVPPAKIIPGKSYFLFSHTIKKQAYNQVAFRQYLSGKNTLIDYECLTDEAGNRTVAFGHYAGIIGAYNGIRAWGLKQGTFTLRPAHECKHMAVLLREYAKITLPPQLKVVVTGAGRVSRGVQEVLDGMGLVKVSPQEYLHQTFDHPVYTVLRSSDYHTDLLGQAISPDFFHQNPSLCRAHFLPFAQVSDILMAAAYWNPAAPALFTEADTQKPDFRLKIIADITCDIQGSIPTTQRASTIPDPFYDYDPLTGSLQPAFSAPQHITVMAVDNLPCELPRDASLEFGNQLMQHVIPQLALVVPAHSVHRATLVKHGELMPRFHYLAEYAGLHSLEKA